MERLAAESRLFLVTFRCTDPILATESPTIQPHASSTCDVGEVWFITIVALQSRYTIPNKIVSMHSMYVF